MNTASNRELTLTRLIDAPREKLFAAWTQPELLKQWFCPKPWFVSDAQLDVRPGGSNVIVMNGPNGEIFPNKGIYLDVEEGSRVVFTNLFEKAWEPAEKSDDPMGFFFVGIITFEDEDGKTRYTATVRHWSVDDCRKHEEMGFHEGWGKATDQLEELVRVP